MTQQAVIVYFTYESTDLGGLSALEDELQEAIASAEAGEYDGNEIAQDGSDGTLFMYGPDADRLLHVVEPILRACPFMKGARVMRRYGDAKSSAPEVMSIMADS